MKERRSKETEIGMIPEEYALKEIGNGAKVFSGFAFKSVDLNNQEGIPVVKIGNIHDGGVTLDGSQFFPEDLVNDKITKFFLEDRDVLIAMTGQGSVGRVGQIRLNGEKVLLNQRVGKFIVDNKNLDKDYLYFVISSPRYETILFDTGSGSGQPNLSPSQILSVEIPFPEYNTQVKISEILRSLNDKIELNQQMNKTLEEIGQAIFKRWFVDFEFPNEKGKPYKSSGGEMVDSELGKMPKEWKVFTLQKFITVERGLSYKGSGLTEHGLPMINLANFAPNHGFIHSGTKPYSGEYKERNLVRPGDIVIANTDITQKRDVLGSPAIVPKLGSEKILFTHHVYAMRNNSWIPNYFIYYLLQLKQYKDRTRGFATGTTVLFLPDDAILDFQFVLSNKELVENFVLIMKTFQDMLNLNILEHITLTTLRDSLLPKLMSGKIRVPV